MAQVECSIIQFNVKTCENIPKQKPDPSEKLHILTNIPLIIEITQAFQHCHVLLLPVKQDKIKIKVENIVQKYNSLNSSLSHSHLPRDSHGICKCGDYLIQRNQLLTIVLMQYKSQGLRYLPIFVGLVCAVFVHEVMVVGFLPILVLHQ